MAVSEIHGIKSTLISLSEVQQSYYTIDDVCRAYSDGCFTFVNIIVTCVTPYSDSPGANCFSGLPVPKQDVYISIPSNSFGDPTRPLRVCVRNGYLYCRHGTAGRGYDICFMYPNA